jgi:putative intracellular protease/amidase
MDIAIPLFEGITALDAIGPYEVLSRLPGARVRFVAVTPGPYRTDNRQLTLMADEPLSAVPHPEVLMVPGGFGTRALEAPNPLLDWIRAAHETSQWTTSVCTGSMLLAAAGILKGLEATTHWMSLDRLPAYGARPTPQARGGAGQDHHRGRRILRHRHGAHAGRPHRGRRRRAGHPARDRVRPAAAVPSRLTRDGPRAHRGGPAGADAGPDGPRRGRRPQPIW